MRPAEPGDDAVVGVAGGGLMGTGIATLLACAGASVRVLEPDAGARAAVPGRCAAALAEAAEAGRLTPDAARAALARIRAVAEPQALTGLDFVIEAVFENLEVKQALFARLEAVLDARTIVASSTSGLEPDRLCAGMRHPERLVVAHFWNPPLMLPLVEVIGAAVTAPEVVEATMRRLAGWGCEPVRLARAVPGFVGNRLQFAVLREGVDLFSLSKVTVGDRALA